jgi:SSS family solute:Na+ symporter
VWLSRGVSLLWGLFSVVSGLAFARSGGGVLELVNQVGSAFYGPVLAVFVLGVAAPRVTGRAAVIGLGAGLAANAALALFAPQVSWLWWNAAGFVASAACALAGSGFALARPAAAWPRRESYLLTGAFVVLAALLAMLPRG